MVLGFVIAIGYDYRNPRQEDGAHNGNDLEPAIDHKNEDDTDHANTHGYRVLDHAITHVFGVGSSGVCDAVDFGGTGKSVRFPGHLLQGTVFSCHN